MRKRARMAALSLALIGVLGGGTVGMIPTVVGAETVSQQVSPEVRSELTRVKQSVAFAENLQKEAKQDPQDIYKSLDDARSILDRLLADTSLSPEMKAKLEVIKSGTEKIRSNVNDTAAYAEVRRLLEPLTDNPGE